MHHEEQSKTGTASTKMEIVSQVQVKAAAERMRKQNLIVARAFCERDYGFAALRKELLQSHEKI